MGGQLGLVMSADAYSSMRQLRFVVLFSACGRGLLQDVQSGVDAISGLSDDWCRRMRHLRSARYRAVRQLLACLLYGPRLTARPR